MLVLLTMFLFADGIFSSYVRDLLSAAVLSAHNLPWHLTLARESRAFTESSRTGRSFLVVSFSLLPLR